MTTFLQYDIVIVNLDPTIGSEIKKKRPCVIVSPNEMNKHLYTLVDCPVTSNSRNYPREEYFQRNLYRLSLRRDPSSFIFLKRQKTVISNLLANPPLIVVGLSF